MATIKQLMSNLATSRDDIRAKLIEMGIVLASDAHLSVVAEAAKGINVDTTTATIPLTSGQTFTLEPGKYYAKEVTIIADAAELDNQYYAGSGGMTLSGNASISFTLSETPTDGNQYHIKSQTPVTVNAPTGYTIDSITVGEIHSSDNQSIGTSNFTASATKSEDNKSATISLGGYAIGAIAASGTVQVSYTMVCIAGADYTGGAAVTPTTEAQHFYATDGKFMTAFTVNAIPIENGEVTDVSALITDFDNKDAKYTVAASDGNYMQSVTIDKVVIDTIDVESDVLYNNTSDPLVVDASAFGYDGISSITIPRPAMVEATEGDTEVDLLNLELTEGGSDHVVSLPAGYYAASTEITIHTDELYDELAAI